MKNKLLIIYPNAVGVSADYLKSIAQSIDNSVDFKIICAYGDKYPNNFYPLFYRFSKLDSKLSLILPRVLRLLLRYIELSTGLLVVLFYSIFFGYKHIWVNFNSATLSESLFVLIAKKFFKRYIIATVHDIKPFKRVTLLQRLDPSSLSLKLLFEEADLLIFHNNLHIKTFQDSYPGSINCASYTLLFPPAYLDALPYCSSNEPISNNKFLFLGHLRSEKGILDLIEAFNKFAIIYPEVTLEIIGNPTGIPVSMLSNIRKSCRKSIFLNPKFLSDKAFYQKIATSDFLVLPYRVGYNSAFPLNAAALGINTISSNLAVFTQYSEFDIIDQRLIFSHTKNSYCPSLLQVLCLTQNYKPLTKIQLQANHSRYSRIFSSQMNELLSMIFINT